MSARSTQAEHHGRVATGDRRAIGFAEAVGERVYRTWVAYLASSSVGFTQGSLGLYQVVAARPDPAEREVVPTTREPIYAPAAPSALARRAS